MLLRITKLTTNGVEIRTESEFTVK